LEETKEKRARILIVDDIAANIQLQQAYLSALGYDTIVARNGEEALEKAYQEKPDMVLLDVMMPKLNGFETCKRLKSNNETRYIPVIMVTALNEIEDKMRGIEAGADDFISKPFNKLELLARVKSLLRIKHLHNELQQKIEELEKAQERLRELAITDGLTELYNYRYFKEHLEQELRRSERHGSNISVVMLDIDFFKNYNDTHGHLAGDKVLKDIANLLKNNIRRIDVAARYGGEEFSLILIETPKKSAQFVAEKLKDLVEQHKFRYEDSQPDGLLTISMGIATFPEDGDTADEVVHQADQRLYKAKALGRNRVISE
jgi:two-component system cell cycle response regulator